MRPRLVLFGDSITQQSFMPGGWGARLTDAYQRTLDVVLRGYSGYNTRWALRLLPSTFPPAEAAQKGPALVTVLLGANDSVRPPPLAGQTLDASRQHVPVDEYGANLARICAAARAAGAQRVLFVTPPPVAPAKWHAFLRRPVSEGGRGLDIPADAELVRRNEITGAYAARCRDVAKDCGVPCVDLWTAFQAKEDWADMFPDGLHPNGDGGEVIFNEVIAAIRREFPPLAPEALDLDFPEHREVDPVDIDDSFDRHRKRRKTEGKLKLSMLARCELALQ